MCQFSCIIRMISHLNVTYEPESEPKVSIMTANTEFKEKPNRSGTTILPLLVDVLFFVIVCTFLQRSSVDDKASSTFVANAYITPVLISQFKARKSSSIADQRLSNSYFSKVALSTILAKPSITKRIPDGCVAAVSSVSDDGNNINKRDIETRSRRFRLQKQDNDKDCTVKNNDDVPPLGRNPPRKVCLMIEPTPFTHVSGYANRFKEMLKFLKKAGDDVDILTVDTKTPAKDLPKNFLGYPIRHTQGFTFPLYNHISLTMDLPELKGARIIERLNPDLIHVTSPGFLLFAALFYARVMKIPLVISYHTHLPTYGT